MRMKQTGIAILVFVAVVIAAAAFSAERQGPRIYVKDSKFDFGTVRAGSQPEHIFEIMNVGDEVLELRQIQPT